MKSCRVTTSGIGPLLMVASLTEDVDGVAVLPLLLALVGVALFCLSVT